MVTDNDKRIKKLEQDIAWMQKDIINLINIIECIKPEEHFHYYYDLRKCTDDQSQSNDLNDFI
jgi:hypothetical protein